jgi:hypothetical protein
VGAAATGASVAGTDVGGAVGVARASSTVAVTRTTAVGVAAAANRARVGEASTCGRTALPAGAAGANKMLLPAHNPIATSASAIEMTKSGRKSRLQVRGIERGGRLCSRQPPRPPSFTINYQSSR